MMKISKKQQKFIDIIQWICIIFLLAVCAVIYIDKKNTENFINSEEYRKEQTYIKIYESQKIEALKKENKELYDSIKTLKNVESAVEIRYKYKYITDTIYKNEFIVKAEENKTDSLYHYDNGNDTVNIKIDVKANELKWVKSHVTINDKFMIINREENDLNQTIVHHPNNVEITGMDTWHRKEQPKWYEKITVSPQIGIGYGLYNHKIDMYVGFGIGYEF